MALPSNGAISLNQMHVEVGGSSGSTASLNDSDIRGLISKSSGATMAFNEWYGASSEVDTITLNSVNYQDTDKYNSYYYGARVSGFQTPTFGSFVDNTLQTTGGTILTVGRIYTGNSDLNTPFASIAVAGDYSGGGNSTTFTSITGYATIRSSNGNTTYLSNSTNTSVYDSSLQVTYINMTFNNHLPTGNNLKLKAYT